MAGLCCLLTGCVAQGSGRHFIIGFGIVDIPKTNAVHVTRVKSLGVYAGSGFGPRLGLGYMDSRITAISDGATNVILELK